jgi:prepilin-type processing-associated H-X9-DG protein
MVVGPLRPVILLPSDWEINLDETQRRMVLAHEIAHIAGNDLRMALVPQLVESLFFFLPTTWLARREWTLEREVACDVKAIAISGQSAARYAALLLRIVNRVPQVGLTTVMGATSGFHQTKKRLLMLENLSNRHSRTLRVGSTALLACAIAGVLPWRGMAQAGPVRDAEMKARRQETVSNAKHAALAIILYEADHNLRFPSASSSTQVWQKVSRYVKTQEVFKTRNPNGGHFTFNKALSGVLETAVKQPAWTAMIYDDKAWPDGQHVVAFADGHVKLLRDEVFVQTMANRGVIPDPRR